MLYVAYALFGASIYILAYQFFKMGQAQKAALTGYHGAVSESLILKLSLPIVRTYILPSVKSLQIDHARKQIQKKIMCAGMSDDITPDEYFSLKILLACLLPLVAVIYNLTLDLTNPFLLILIFAPMGWAFPNLWLKNLITKRKTDIRLAIPFVVDLMSLCTEAGLDFMAAIDRVVQKARPSPLIEELRQVLRELKVGATRAQALRNMSDRVEMPEVSSLVAVLVTADQMGASISEVLKQQSEQIRVDRFIKAEKEGAKASQKVLLPTIVFIVPAVFIVVLGPIAARLIVQIFSGGINLGGGFL